ncbi:shikimate kinase [Magnetovibrio sp.]|uniref:shikimate kinase n=1 Tax=Magnetovibrio sp. TaxID=2024836 RepID=UPI002F95464B
MVPRITRPVVLIGLMGAGKSTVGRRLAKKLAVPFVDSDDEIKKAAGCSIEDIFKLFGEEEFRAGEKRVMERLLEEGPMVLATGGGVFMNPEVRARILQMGTAVWLKAGLEALAERTSRRGGRPLLQTSDPKATLKKLIDERYPVYREAPITIDTDDETHESAVELIIEALKDRTDI